MGRFNFKGYEARQKSYESDLDIKKLSKELVSHHSTERQHSSKYPDKAVDKVGVILYFMNGQNFKTPEFTSTDIDEVLYSGKRWLNQKNGGAINLGYVVRYSPYNFYKDSHYKVRNKFDGDIKK